MEFLLLALPALLSIINPLGGAFIFLGATSELPDAMRSHLARWVAIHSFILINVSLYIGAFVLEFFGISLPVLRVAGGIIITMTGWNLLNSKDKPDPDLAIHMASDRDASRMAFYPLTMPLTAGPGTISVAIALGTSRPADSLRHFVKFVLSASGTALLICLLIYLCYNSAERIAKVMGPTGTTIVLRLSAFLLFCIGIQVFWNGAFELLSSIGTVPPPSDL